jgi:hypothetical protein
MTGIVSTFETWIRFCFDRQIGDVPNGDEAAIAEPTPAVLATYLCQLFERPSILLTQFSVDQIGQGLWFICGSQSEYFRTARDRSVPQDLQIAWVRRLKNLYSGVFEQVCAQSLGHLSGWPEAPNLANDVCYMLWDLDCLEGAAMFPGHEHLIDPIFEVLESVVRSDHPACIESALHALGHLHDHHPSRVEALIDGFLARNSVLPELIRYGQQARTGRIN